MLDVQYIETRAGKIAYHIFGRGKITAVIEMGLGAAMGEWWHIAEHLGETETVLLYERAGFRENRLAENRRVVSSVISCMLVDRAQELWRLLELLPHEEQIIIIAHSQGGLYAQQFLRLYPKLIKGLVLLDPLSARDNVFREKLSTEEFQKSGVDKFSNLKLPRTMAKLHLGFIIKAMMKSAPPF
ncbi:MAG: alpha/beta fold hydrolase [Lachnospiraceae bacterium]|nr:alpha/beta fold hydrolase [Lachnospiraceae bacterium]